jgi:hypothetical protein
LLCKTAVLCIIKHIAKRGGEFPVMLREVVGAVRDYFTPVVYNRRKAEHYTVEHMGRVLARKAVPFKNASLI